MTNQRSARRYRVRRRADIARIFDDGRRAADALLTLFAAPNGLDHSRAAFGVSKRHGNAVRRNRIRRVCREAFRLSREDLPTGWDFMIVPRAGRSAVVFRPERIVAARMLPNLLAIDRLEKCQHGSFSR